MNKETTLRAYVLQRLHARFLALLIAVSVISCGSYFFANQQSNRHQLLRSLEVSKQVLLQAFDAGDPNLTVAYLKSTIEQGNFYRVEVRDKKSGASLFGPLSSRSARYFETCASTDLGSRFGAELVACRRVAGIPEIFACAAFVLVIALVSGLGIRFIQKELSDWSDGLSETLDRLSALGMASLEDAERAGARVESPVREVADLHRRIIQILADSRKIIELEAAAKVSAQVAHDIQSPLAALEGVAREMGDIADDERGLMTGALSRIRGIVEDLRRRENLGTGGSTGGKAPAAQTVPVDVGALVREMVAEKRAQYRAMEGVSFGFSVAHEGEVFVQADAKELSRVISNLVNNSVEALPDSRGRVELEVKSSDGMIEIRVLDDGAGIPAEVLPLLGREGATFGKARGSGLGLFHARKTVEAWGGRLDLERGATKGAVVRVFIPARGIVDHAGAVLIDDDPLVRANWGLAARRAGRSFRAYANAVDFLRDLDAGNISRSSEIFIDCELGDGVRGETAALQIHRRGCADISLATGHSPESLPAMPHIKRIVGKSPPW